MAQTSPNFQFLLRALKSPDRAFLQEKPVKGFTLIELLVVVLIAGGIISGLMYLVVELLTADRVEAARTETQQEMQLALDYISTELRQAVYVYDEDCMNAGGVGAPGDADFCPGLYDHIPAGLTQGDRRPILAFWKHQQLPSSVRDLCGGGGAPAGTPCVTGHSYALIVYTLDQTDGNPTWEGKARITRYALTQFEADADPTTGYVDPGNFNRDFRSWPFYSNTDGGTPTNQQGTRPTGAPQVLVDFVDDEVRAGIDAACPDGYSLTTESNVPTDFANSFYGCVRDLPNDADGGLNRDTIVFLRGNPSGRPGIRENVDVSFMPTLETQVLSRPVLEKSPVN